MDKLCDWAGDQEVMVASLYFDFAAQKEQSPASMLGAVLITDCEWVEKGTQGNSASIRRPENGDWWMGTAA